MRKLTLLLMTVALGVVTAAGQSYKFEITSPTWVGNTELQEGNYRIEMNGDKAIIREGHDVVAEVPAMMEHNATKYNYSSLSVSHADANKPMLDEVRVGGTDTKIVIKN